MQLLSNAYNQKGNEYYMLIDLMLTLSIVVYYKISCTLLWNNAQWHFRSSPKMIFLRNKYSMLLSQGNYFQVQTWQKESVWNTW